MSSRTYLSIGDVLTLLREEFPDVTISKIRFLESQGLVNPERSPSGYRKFFEHDVERLRWVLRQQREHFLPLKVIRDRLSEGELTEEGESAPAAVIHRNGKTSQPAHAVVGAGAGAGVGVVANGGGGASRSTARTEEQLAKADDEAMARILADASRRAALMPESPAVPVAVAPPAEESAERAAAGGATVGSGPARTVKGVVPPRRHADGSGRVDGPSAGGGAGAGEAGAGRIIGNAAAPGGSVRRNGDASSPSPAGVAATARTTAPRPTVGPAPEATAAAPAPKAAASAATTPRSSVSTGMVTGASLTAEELCAASGLSEVELAGLQGFGMIEAVIVAGIPTFDEDALTVANLAAQFRAFGIEARHLRLYRNAVDREMGLIEQVIIPLLRQRNPESRQRAVDGAEQLGSLGQTMRATLLRTALRRHIGG